MEEELNHKIERFLDGKMSEEEALLFEKEIQENESLREEVALSKSVRAHFSGDISDAAIESEYQKELSAYIHSNEGKQAEEKLLKVRQEYHQNDRTQSKPKGKLITWIVSSAAIIALIISSILFLGKSSTIELYQAYYDATELPSFTGRSDDETIVLNQALEKFNRNEYQASLVDFNTYIQSQENINPLVYIYTGMIESELGNPEKAIEQFDILEKLPIEDSSRALWYKGLTYLKFDKVALARATLSQLIGNEANYKYKEAKELLNELE